MTTTITRSVYRCNTCTAERHRRNARCTFCGGYGTLRYIGTEEVTRAPKQGMLTAADLDDSALDRIATGIAGLDEVLGEHEDRGVARGAAIICAGQPGIGKTTVWVQAMLRLADRGLPCVFGSAEMSGPAAKRYMQRLGPWNRISSRNVYVHTAGDLEGLLAMARAVEPVLLVVDSFQRHVSTTVDARHGGPTQLAHISKELIGYAHTSNAIVAIISQVTAEGDPRGGRDKQHDVDVVMGLERCEEGGDLIEVHCEKNRTGRSDLKRMMRMTSKGLIDCEGDEDGEEDEEKTRGGARRRQGARRAAQWDELWVEGAN